MASTPPKDPAGWRRTDGLVLLGAAALLLLRWPDRARTLESWDANTFALAVDRYDVYAHRPHAPGYPVYVALAKLLDAAVQDPTRSLILLSFLLTLVALAAFYRLSVAVAGRPVAAGALALLLAAPVVYVHSLTANAYAAEMACSVLVAWAAWRAHEDPRPWRVGVVALALALAIGVRPSIAFYLTPLAAWAVLRPPWDLRTQARRLLPATLVGVAVCLAWALPMLALSGGYGAWQAANRIQGGQVVFARTLYNAGWPALRENLGRLALFLRWELRWVLPACLALLAVGLALRRGRLALRWSPRATFLAAWTAPALWFFATVYSGYHEGPSGYVLVVLPALLLAAGLACERALRPFEDRRHAAALALAALVVASAGLAAHRHDVADVGYREHDAWAESWSHLPESFPPSNSSIVALWHFAHVWNGYRDYTSYNYRPLGDGPELPAEGVFVQVAKGGEATPDWYSHETSKDGPRHLLPDGTEHLVLFDFQLAGENGGPRRVLPEVPVREAFLPNGWRVLVVDTTPDRPHLEDYFFYEGP